MKRIIYHVVIRIAAPVVALPLLMVAVAARFFSQCNERSPRLIFGPVPIIANMYWARAMKEAGFQSRTFMDGFYETINKATDYDILLENRYGSFPNFLKFYLAFGESLLTSDIFIVPFSGGFLGKTPLWRLESALLRVAAKRTIAIPYGSDAYVYHTIRSVSAIHGLLLSYPLAGRRQRRVAARVDYWCRNADLVLAGIMGPDGFGRWDALLPSTMFIDTAEWQVSTRESRADGRRDTVYVAHAPNHRGCKGTEFVIEVVKSLQSEGLKIELLLIEKMQNSEVKEMLRSRVDILVDQVILTGHGLNAVEGLCSGLPVIANFEDDNAMDAFRRWSYFDECPMVSADPESLKGQLRELVTNPALRLILGNASRRYAEKYQSLEAARYLFGAAIDYLFGRVDNLMGLYHPLTGEYPRRLSRIEHPLIKNKVV